MTELRTIEQLKDGIPQVVENSATDQVLSNAFEIGAWDALNLAFQVTVADVSGTGGVVKLQGAIDGTNFTDIDATNAKVTISDDGRFPLFLCSSNSTFAASMPLPRYLRFVVTTGGSDAMTVTSIKVQKAL